MATTMEKIINVTLTAKVTKQLSEEVKDVYLVLEEGATDTDYTVNVFGTQEEATRNQWSDAIGLVDEVGGVTEASDVSVLYNAMKELRRGKIVKAQVAETLPQKNANVHNYLLAVNVEQFEKRKPIQTDKVWKWKVSGRTSRHQAKAEVIRAFEEANGTAVQVNVIKEDGEIKILFPGKEINENGKRITAGTIENSISDVEFAEVSTVLETLHVLEGRVVDVQHSTYFIEVSAEKEVVEAVKSGKPIETILHIKEEIVKTIGTPMAVLDDIEAYLLGNNIPKRDIKDIFKKHTQYPESEQHLIPAKPKTPYMDKEGLLADSIIYLLGGDAQLLEGDASVGKNVLVQTMAWVLQKPLITISMNAQVDKFELVGSPTAKMEVDQNGNGVSVVGFNPSGLVRMMQCGGMVLLDELNASNPAVMTVLHNITEKSQKSIDIEGYGHVKADDGFVVYGAYNPGFEGTVELNEAFDSRFPTLDFGKNKSIIDLLRIHDESKHVDEQTLGIIEQVYVKLYEMVAERNEIDAKILAFRRFASAAYYSERMGLEKALRQNVANKASDEGQKTAIMDVIDAYC